MGKRKLEINYIEDPRRRTSVFFNRRSGIFKKAHDLTKTCGTTISVILSDLKGNLHVYSNTESIRLFLKKSALKEAKSKRIRVFRYHDADYPFMNLSHVGRENQIYEEKDFASQGILDPNSANGDHNGFDEMLGKRKRLKMLSESISQLRNENSDKIENHTLSESEAKKLEKRIQELSQGTQMSNFGDLGSSNNDMEAEVKEVRTNHIHRSEEHHLRSLLSVVMSFQQNQGLRVLELSNKRPIIVEALNSFYDFISDRLTNKWDSFVIDYSVWRLIAVLYFNESDQLCKFSKLIKKVPVEEMINFINLRPPAEPKKPKETSDDQTDTEETKKSKGGSSTLDYTIKTPKSDPQARGYQKTSFMTPPGVTMETFYSKGYLSFIEQVKKYLDVFIRIILQKIHPGPLFNLTDEVQKVKIPSRAKIFKKLVLKKVVAIRSAWLLNGLKNIKASPADIEMVRKVRTAKSINGIIKESIDPAIISKMCKDGQKFGILHWLKIQDLLIEKFLDDFHLYGSSQKLITEVSSIVGIEKSIYLMMKGVVANKIFNVSYSNESTPAQNLSVKRDDEVTGEERSEVGCGLGSGGSFKTPRNEVRFLDGFRRLGSPRVLSGGDNESLLNFFDMEDDDDKRSVLSFKSVSGFSAG